MKSDLRKKFKEKRKAFLGEERALANQKICTKFLNNFGDYNSFFIYNSFGSEVDTSSIIATLLNKNRKIYLPKIINKTMFASPYSTKVNKGVFGINEPDEEAFLGEIEVAVIPLLAANKKGFRLGYGGGFYDKFLNGKNIIKVGVAFSFQIIDENFEEEWDEPLDYLITENGVLNYKDSKN